MTKLPFVRYYSFSIFKIKFMCAEMSLLWIYFFWTSYITTVSLLVFWLLLFFDRLGISAPISCSAATRYVIKNAINLGKACMISALYWKGEMKYLAACPYSFIRLYANTLFPAEILSVDGYCVRKGSCEKKKVYDIKRCGEMLHNEIIIFHCTF